MTTTTDIARTHGYTGPTNCQDCGTTESVHFGSWFDPKTRESGDFLRCCACGIKAGDPIYTHAECGAPIAQFIPNQCGDPHSELAYKRIHARAIEAYMRGQHGASLLGLEGREATGHALTEVLEAVGRAYAAAAINQVAYTLTNKLDEDTFVALGDIAATLDLEVVEDLNGANGTGEDDSGPEVRVFHRADGWTGFSSQAAAEPCTSNHQREQAGMPSCTATAVWKVVELHDTGDVIASISFWCDDDLPSEHRQPTPSPNA